MLRLTARQVKAAVGGVVALIFIHWFTSSSDIPSHIHLPSTHSSNASSLWQTRSVQLKDAFLGAYQAYEKYALPADELLPVALEGSNNLNGWGLTVVDALDTIIIMDLKPEYTRALDHVRKMQIKDTRAFIPVFETSIRYLGGFLSAYALTSDELFLRRADELGQVLLPAFGSVTGLPQSLVNPSTGVAKNGASRQKARLSETTAILEFNVLAEFTKKKDYTNIIDRLQLTLEASQGEDGALPTFWNVETGEAMSNQFAVGGNADSAYEYLLKMWLQDTKLAKFRQMYIKAANGIISRLLYLSPNRHLLYVTDIANLNAPIPSGKLEHLSCFLPGLLALGVHTLHEHLTLRERRIHMWAAEGLAQTCWLLSADSISGLAPEEVIFTRWPKSAGPDGDERVGRWSNAIAEWERASGSRWRKGGVWGNHEEANLVPPGVRTIAPVPSGKFNDRDYWLRRSENSLRPEVIESLYLLWKTTHDPKWRERGWQVCSAFHLHSRTPSGGYSAVRRVDSIPVRWTDSMPSWFLAETLKYCYLLTVDHDVTSLEDFVFNTEAHPLPRKAASRWRKAFGDQSLV